MNPSGRILVVEDDDGVRELICSLLEDEGFKVVAAEHGGMALALVEHSPPQLILADISMPVMDGCTFAQECRQRWSATPIIALTGTDDPIGSSGFAVFDDIISKPFDVSDLLEIIGRYVKVGAGRRGGDCSAGAGSLGRCG